MRNKYLGLAIAGLSIVAVAGIVVRSGVSKTEANNEFVRAKVIDGDTIEINNGERVRLIGIDTPEVYLNDKLYRDAGRTGKDAKTIQKLGKKSSEYAKKLLNGKKIILKYDPANEYVKHRDKYGRLLAYIYLPDGTFFNKKIIEDGYAFAYTKYPFQYLEEFRNCERIARENKAGLWQDDDFTNDGAGKTKEVTASETKSIEMTDYVASKKSQVYHKKTCGSVAKIKKDNLVCFSNEDDAKKSGRRACAVCGQ